jgi:hypothetical protein
MAKLEKDDLGGIPPSPEPEWVDALTIPDGRNWRQFFWHETLPPKWQGAMIACAAQGMSEVETMVNMQVTEPCWLRWEKKSAEFREVRALCKNISQAWFEAKARANLENPYFKEKLWAMIVTARFDDPLQLRAPKESFRAREAAVVKEVPFVDESLLDHLLDGGDGTGDKHPKKPA